MSAENPFKSKDSFTERITSEAPSTEELQTLAQEIGGEELVQRVTERFETGGARKAQFTLLAYLDGYSSMGPSARFTEEEIRELYERVGFTAEERDVIRNYLDSPLGSAKTH